MLSPLNTRHRNGLASCLTDAHFFVYLSTEQAKRTASEKEQRATTREKTRVQHRKSENRKRKELNCLLTFAQARKAETNKHCDVYTHVHDASKREVQLFVERVSAWLRCRRSAHILASYTVLCSCWVKFTALPEFVSNAAGISVSAPFDHGRKVGINMTSCYTGASLAKKTIHLFAKSYNLHTRPLNR